MIIKKKETPANDSSAWTKEDRKTLKSMYKGGKSIKEIAEALGRTPAAVQYQKSSMGLSEKRVKKDKSVKMKTKEGKSVEVKVAEAMSNPVASPRDKAKEMTSVARQIARANGKRITMAMFFVEDL
jgi:hypothetical protein